MQKALIGKKIGMTQIFDEAGKVIPVTVVEAGPCNVVSKKTVEVDGYEAVQLGFGDIKVQRVSKPLAGHFKKNDVAPYSWICQSEHPVAINRLKQKNRKKPMREEWRLTKRQGSSRVGFSFFRRITKIGTSSFSSSKSVQCWLSCNAASVTP